ncbi:hypothetical protein V501_04826 [Pseudogymnoascus sp. VKM F-4519 (FW-2642)]|nr:hypothetical protein V501_04826 [Pseudogymnoascus sp. VKM F-4519 (FW-2642)]
MGRREEAQGDGDDEEEGVELGGGDAVGPELEVATVELANGPHAADDEEDDEEEERVRHQAVDAEHHEYGGIVAGEVAQVPVDARLGLAEVGGLGQALEVEELGDGLDVGEAGADGLRAEASKAVGEVESRREDVQGDLNACHCEGWVVVKDELRGNRGFCVVVVGL